MSRIRLVFASMIVSCALAAGARGVEDADLRLGDLVTVRMVDGVLAIEPTGQQVARTAMVKGPEATWTVVKLPSAPGMGPGIQLVRKSEPAADPLRFWTISITSRPDSVDITARRGGRTPYDLQFMLSLRRTGVQVRISDVRRKLPDRMEATDFNDLRLRQPEFTDQCMRPILEQLAGEDLLLPGAADVYRLFSEISPRPDAVAAVQKLLPMLANSSPDQRVGATEQLAALGPDVTCALMHIDAATLDPETQQRVAMLIDSTSRRTASVQQLSRDVDFLIDCLCLDDVRVRLAAGARLEQLLDRQLGLTDLATRKDWQQLAQSLRQARFKQLSRPSPAASSPSG